jgi:hypothetical protein
MKKKSVVNKPAPVPLKDKAAVARKVANPKKYGSDDDKNKFGTQLKSKAKKK